MVGPKAVVIREIANLNIIMSTSPDADKKINITVGAWDSLARTSEDHSSISNTKAEGFAALMQVHYYY
jgi:hypothetical protein